MYISQHVLPVLAITSSAFATVFVTNPTASSSFVGGQPATISWQDDGSAPTLAEFGPAEIGIYVGNALQQIELQTISDNIDVSTASSISFTPNPDIGPNSNEYFIRFTSINLKESASAPAEAFSVKFTLSGMSGTFSQAVQSVIDGQSTGTISHSTTHTTNTVSTTSHSSTTSVPTDSSLSATDTQSQNTQISSNITNPTGTTTSLTSGASTDSGPSVTRNENSAPSSINTTDPTPAPKSGPKAGIIAGSVVGGLFLLGVVLAALYFIRVRRQKRAREVIWRVDPEESDTRSAVDLGPDESGADLIQPYPMVMSISSQDVVPVSLNKNKKVKGAPESPDTQPSSSSKPGLSGPGPLAGIHTQNASNNDSRQSRRGSETERLRDEVENLRKEVELVRAERDMALDKPPPMYDV